MRYTRNQAGDTLVEVVLSIAIISVTLVSAYNIANNSYRIGVQARERIEAANIAQQQAEMLRAWRDKNIEEDNPAGVVPVPSNASGFRVVPIAGGFGSVACSDCPVGPGGRYKLKITSSGSGPDISAPAGADGSKYIITLKWDRIGGSGEETARMTTTLVDRRIDKTRVDCGEGLEVCG